MLVAFGALNLANGAIGFLCGSAEGGVMGALVVASVIFVVVCMQLRAPVLKQLHPPGAVYRLPRVRALAVIKTALSVKYFDESKRWRPENIDVEEGTAHYVCDYMYTTDEKTSVNRTVLLTVSVKNLGDVINVSFEYEPIGLAPIEQIEPAELCKQTTNYLEEELESAELMMDQKAA